MIRYPGGGFMRWNVKGKAALLIAAIMLITMLSGCSTRENEAAKQIENYMKEQEQLAKSYINIDIEKLDAQNAMNIIQELASEKYKGRKTGTVENEIALEYIEKQFRAMGLKNPESLDDFRQYFYQPVTLLKDTPRLALLEQDGKTIKDFEYPKNFAFRVLSDSTQDISINAPMHIMNSAAEINDTRFSQQEVLLFPIEAQGRSSAFMLMREMYHTKAAAIILEVDVSSENRKNSDLLVYSLNNRSWGPYYKPVISVDTDTFLALEQAAAEQKMINIQCSYEEKERYKTANLVGYIPGSDKELKDQYIIVGGHMDHVGDNMNGTYNAGAFDNASGTAAMMEIARVISESTNKPKKSLVFIAFNGEEHGLIGSEYYVSSPVFPLKNSVMINLDMIGSSAILPLSVAVNRGHIVDLRSEFLELAKVLEIDALEDNNISSDHFYFGEKSVPTVMLTHMDVRNGYHSPNDTLEDVDQKRLGEAIELVLHYIDKKAY
jgi:hypothetical protein